MKKIITTLCFFVFSITVFAQTSIRKPVIKVNNADEFVKAIGPNRIVELNVDTFYLRGIEQLKDVDIEAEKSLTITPYVSYGPGNGLTIKNVNNLEIIGTKTGNRHSILSSRDYGDAILSFVSCNQLVLKKFEANHIPKAEGHCTGGVISIEKSENVFIDSCVLIGSGSFGVNLFDCKDILCSNIQVKECSIMLSELERNENVLFENCEFLDIRCDGHLIYVTDCRKVVYKKCVFTKNYSYTDPKSSWYKEEREKLVYFYNDTKSSGFVFEDCTFTENKLRGFSNKPEVITKTNNTFIKNDQLK